VPTYPHIIACNGAIIKSLRVRVEQLERAIGELEALSSPSGTQSDPLDQLKVSRRGRKSMGEAERREVSERMKRYWAGRKK
jgi:hypothetical protein